MLEQEPTNKPPSEPLVEVLPAPQRDERGRVLPGNTLNPSGRTKADRALRDACRLHAEEQVPKVLAIINDPATPPHVKLDGIRLLWERGYGRAPIAIPDDDDLPPGTEMVFAFRRSTDPQP